MFVQKARVFMAKCNKYIKSNHKDTSGLTLSTRRLINTFADSLFFLLPALWLRVGTSAVGALAYAAPPTPPTPGPFGPPTPPPQGPLGPQGPFGPPPQSPAAGKHLARFSSVRFVFATAMLWQPGLPNRCAAHVTFFARLPHPLCIAAFPLWLYAPQLAQAPPPQAKQRSGRV